MKHRLTLDYALGRGVLAPYLDALIEGVALAGHCPHCGRTSFPPERRCRCTQGGGDDTAPGWVRLTGQAHILFRTDGLAGSFALAQFDGADNQTVCRIANPPGNGSEARLVASDDGKPGIVVEITGETIETTE
ncbi:MAG: hypothetical protein NXI27_26015 [Alphaproteobacteria bacterium]|nr:hypothetical protein [Alphaproteobacteria bacterium]